MYKTTYSHIPLKLLAVTMAIIPDVAMGGNRLDILFSPDDINI